ncbi:hypothetical protein B7494_g759 [Chlorociboria aeruginascens]|nr:hypothetical protein B7494_g759 [Chlorociboria aeruginascens]
MTRASRTDLPDLPTISTDAPEVSPTSPWILGRSASNLSDERTPLLRSSVTSRSKKRTGDRADSPTLTRHGSSSNVLSGSLKKHSRHQSRHHSRAGSLQRLVSALTLDRYAKDPMRESKGSMYPDDRVWYDQFSSTDWVRDSIKDAVRVSALRSRKDIRGRIFSALDGAQGWILSALVGFIVATIAYAVDVSEAPVFDWKVGYCSSGFFLSEKRCCPEGGLCEAWKSWSNYVRIPGLSENVTEFSIYVCLVVAFSTLSCLLTLLTRTVVPSTYHISTLDENLGALARKPAETLDGSGSPAQILEQDLSAPMVYYTAAGSGVAEVRVILSGFVLHGFLGVKTLVIKTLALVLSVASGLSLGKEGPFVHIATCVGNIACRLFAKYDQNDGKRREVLSAAAAAGVAVAFGAPIGGVLFSLEEVAYFFPAKTLFRTFFCCITAALSLKFLNPYGTNKVVMFEVRYLMDWAFFELAAFILVGILGGATGAIFIKASRSWAKSFRKIPIVKRWPLVEVILVALLTGLVSYWNPYTKIPVAKLLFNLSRPCDADKPDDMGLCPTDPEEIFAVISDLAIAFFIKGILTIITFGIDLLTNLNSYPFLNNKHKPVFTSDLADITPRIRPERIIDISSSPLVSASSLREKLEILHKAGEIDGGLPIIRNEILVGLIPAPDLEFALDNLEDEPNSLCLMATVNTFEESDDDAETDPTDFTPFIDPAPMALDIHSPMDLVYECFVKLGLRFVCVTKEGRYAGLTHKKTFVKYMRELEEKEDLKIEDANQPKELWKTKTKNRKPAVNMTTAHRPTFDPAVGKEAQRGPAYHQRLLPAHTQLKVRKPGQGGDADKQVRDLRAELLQAEAAHFAKIKGGPTTAAVEPEVSTNTTKRRLENGQENDFEENPEAKRRRILEETRDIDADSDNDDGDSSSEDDRCVGLATSIEWFEETDWAPSDDDEDETAELQRELEKIKRERAEKREQEEREKLAQEEAAREHDIALGNPLLNTKSDFNVKRRWDDDVIFKNQARGTEDKRKKEFVNSSGRQRGDQSYGSGNTGNNDSNSGANYGSTGRTEGGDFGSSTNSGSDSYGSSGRTGGDSGFGNTGSDSYGSSGAGRTGGVGGDTYGSGNTGSDSYGSSGRQTGGDNTDSYGSGNTGSDSYGSSGRQTGSSNTYGSDNTDSYGSGNSGNQKNDSTAGKLMEKAGSMLKNDNLVEKGQTKRAQAGNDDSSNSGGNTDSYGSSGRGNDNY